METGLAFRDLVIARQAPSVMVRSVSQIVAGPGLLTIAVEPSRIIDLQNLNAEFRDSSIPAVSNFQNMWLEAIFLDGSSVTLAQNNPGASPTVTTTGMVVELKNPLVLKDVSFLRAQFGGGSTLTGGVFFNAIWYDLGSSSGTNFARM